MNLKTGVYSLLFLMSALTSLNAASETIPASPPDNLAQKVQRAIKQDPELSSYPITVKMKQQALILQGQVQSDWLLFKANALAKNAGARKIINKINITD
ncbi:MAG: BON domain-containing protein [Proteobacteria bacterium]|nr:BON domain-containing protein [Pseudomonadota bacterium]MDE3207812.1 BON domain-containing protein [Pseudomonadota bacterium]